MTARSTIFLSYRRNASADLARYIHDRLITLGVDVFFDVDDINGGRFATIIEREIIRRDYFLVILTPTTLESDWVRKEIQVALRYHKRIIPLVTQNFDFSRHIPPDVMPLKDYSGIVFDYQYADAAFERVKKALNLHDRVRWWSNPLWTALMGLLALIVAAVALVSARTPDPTANPVLVTATLTSPILTYVSSPTATVAPTSTLMNSATFTLVIPTQTVTVTSMPIQTLVMSSTPTQNTNPLSVEFPCDGHVLPGSGEEMYAVMKSSPNPGAPERPAVKSGLPVRILNAFYEQAAGRLWYKITAIAGTELGWIPSSYLVLGDNCPTP